MNAVFYTKDFFSDLFVCLEVSIFQHETVKVYIGLLNCVVLFVWSLILITVALALDVFQMHRHLNHETHNDLILKQTQTPQLIKSHTRLLYSFVGDGCLY